ncbi:hypothetical protein [Azospirillum sp. sgz301742]
MSIRLSASAVVLVSLLAAPVSAAEPAASSWSGTLASIAIGGVLGAVALPYLYPAVAPTVGSALTTTGGALYAVAPTVGTAALETTAAAGSYAAGATQSASTYVAAQTLEAQTAIGAAMGALIGWFVAR